MFFRHSMIQTIRSWRRSLLFLVLLTLLTAVLGISVGLGTYIRSFLNACRESYTTIGVLEYMGDDYPDDSQYDPAISACYDSMDWEAMKSNDAVEVWDPTGKAFGYVEGRMDKNRAAAYPNNGVLVIYVTDYVEQEGVHVGTVNVQDNWSNSVYIPSSDRLDLTKTHLSYTMVQMELDNDSAAAFAETARGSCAVWGVGLTRFTDIFCLGPEQWHFWGQLSARF